LKIGAKNNISALDLGLVVLSYIITTTLNTYAINSTRPLSGLSEAVDLGNPFYVEHYKDNFKSIGILNWSFNLTAQR
jgi:hypothetical protein